MKNKMLIILLIAIAAIVGVFCGIKMNNKPEKTVDIAEEVMLNTGNTGILIAVVDDQKIMNDGKVYVNLKKNYEEHINQLKNETEKEKEKLKKENDRIAEMRATATQEEFNKEVAKFAKLQQKSSEKINTKLKKIEAAYIDAINKIKTENIDVILAEIAKEQKLSMINSKMTTLYYSSALDITETVLFRLNQKITKADLDI